MNRPSLSNPQRIVHLLVLSLAWGLYGVGLFHIHSLTHPVYDTLFSLFSVEILLLIGVILSWVAYHKRLHRQLGPRKNVTAAPWTYEKDRLGYEISGNLQGLKEKQWIFVTCDPTTKTKIFVSFKNKEGQDHAL